MHHRRRVPTQASLYMHIEVSTSPVIKETWTVSTMLFFYACFPFLAPALQKLQLRHLRPVAWAMYVLQAVAMCSAAPLTLSHLGHSGYWIRMFPPARLPVFIMGVCAGFARTRAGQGETVSEAVPAVPASGVAWGSRACLPGWVLAMAWMGLTAAATVVTYFCSVRLFPLQFYLEVFLPILFYELILAITSEDRLSGFFRSRPLRFLGGISMCIYMVHPLVMEGVALALGKNLQVKSLPWRLGNARPPPKPHTNPKGAKALNPQP